MKPLVVVGSINMDLVSRAAHLPLPGETITGSDFQMHSGGKGANQAVAIARLGHPCILLGKTGSDTFGRQLLETLHGYGVDTRHIESTTGVTGTAAILVDDAGENSIVVTPGANREVTPQYLQKKLDVLRDAAMVLAQLEIPLPTVEWLAETCHRLNVPLVLDPAPAKPLPQELMSRVAWFTPNEIEARFYTQDAASDEGRISALRSSGVGNVIFKRGAEGVLLVTKEGVQHRISAFAVSAIDSTAAGDAFNGAFAVAIARSYGLKESARFAAAAAAVSVTRQGAQPSLPTVKDTENLLRLHRAPGAE